VWTPRPLAMTSPFPMAPRISKLAAVASFQELVYTRCRFRSRKSLARPSKARPGLVLIWQRGVHRRTGGLFQEFPLLVRTAPYFFCLLSSEEASKFNP
jgi:hypothetical protein